jgi:hypothetical protein
VSDEFEVAVELVLCASHAAAAVHPEHEWQRPAHRCRADDVEKHVVLVAVPFIDERDDIRRRMLVEPLLGLRAAGGE